MFRFYKKKILILSNYFSVEVDPPEMTCGMIPGIKLKKKFKKRLLYDQCMYTSLIGGHFSIIYIKIP